MAALDSLRVPTDDEVSKTLKMGDLVQVLASILMHVKNHDFLTKLIGYGYGKEAKSQIDWIATVIMDQYIAPMPLIKEIDSNEILKNEIVNGIKCLLNINKGQDLTKMGGIKLAKIFDCAKAEYKREKMTENVLDTVQTQAGIKIKLTIGKAAKQVFVLPINFIDWAMNVTDNQLKTWIEDEAGFVNLTPNEKQLKLYKLLCIYVANEKIFAQDARLDYEFDPWTSGQPSQCKNLIQFARFDANIVENNEFLHANNFNNVSSLMVYCRKWMCHLTRSKSADMAIVSQMIESRFQSDSFHENAQIDKNQACQLLFDILTDYVKRHHKSEAANQHFQASNKVKSICLTLLAFDNKKKLQSRAFGESIGQICQALTVPNNSYYCSRCWKQGNTRHQGAKCRHCSWQN